ncbi:MULTISPECIES: MBL fold metallo-hydrolase [Bacillus]|uniref:MBL fold metallo-hydrolase n=1 Tax=Bacillus TaxID=1386 RepID=UPI0002DCAB31|nr:MULTISPECIES: MBL fold metallo-hydrolase [Bacillus]
MMMLGVLILVSIAIVLSRTKMVKTKSTMGFIFSTVLIMSILLGGCSSTTESSSSSEGTKNEQSTSSDQNQESKAQEPIKNNKEEKTPATTSPSSTETRDGTLEVHFVDVGQGAAQVIITPNKKVMVIDGGNNDDEDLMVTYLSQLGIKNVDILIGTHPDADHIGGIDAIIDSFTIGKVYMPRIQSSTQTFESVLQSIQNKGLKISTAKAGMNLDLDSAVQAKMIAPIDHSTETNEMSAVVRLSYGEQSFLFTGDAGIESEQKIIASGETVKSTVLLVGHHGSKYSTGESFVQEVQPTYGVIQVGKNNYGHPEDEILSRLASHHVNIYRTDTDGTIVFKTDGTTMKVNKNAWKYTGTTQSKGNTTTEVPKNNTNVTTPITATASIDQPNPGQNASVTVSVRVVDTNGKPVSNANVNLKLHYKSTETEYSGITNENGIAMIQFRTGRAAKGYTVNGDITVSANGQTTSASTAFTPQ